MAVLDFFLRLHRLYQHLTKSLTMSASLLRNRSFVSLTAAQFLGAINDNLFKMVVSLYAVRAVSEQGGSSYLSLSAALLALPYLLFSGYAGHIADVASKRTVLVACKLAEVAIMALGLVALSSTAGIAPLLVVLFLMAAHSSFFSPAKYGSVPEIVPTHELGRANAILESSRYAAIILGTAAGGLAMDAWSGSNPERIGLLAVAIALLGLVFSLGIKPLEASGAARAWPKHPWKGIGDGLARLMQSRSLGLAAASLVFFDALATIMLLDVLLIAKNELGLGDTAAGTVGAFAAIGTVLGALLYGQISAGKVELGVTPIAGIGIAIALFAMGLTSHSYHALVGFLFLLGIFAGLFVVPFVAWLQKASARDEKGLIISTANLFDMAAVLAASGALWLLHDVLDIDARVILLVGGVATLLYVGAMQLLWKELPSHVVLLFRSFRPQSVP